jgi:hypothetical protein
LTIRSLIRSPIRSLASSAFGGGGGLLSQATSQLGGVAPYHYWDFINNRALFAQADVGGVASTPGWSFARASTGYAETAAGVLVPFASGELRRTDKGMLVEGARTNLLLYSQELDNVYWSKVRCSITANATAAPDGTLTADKIVEDGTASATHFPISQSPGYTIVADSTFCISGFFKAGERSWVHLRGGDGTETNAFGKYFNLASGVVGSSTAAGAGALAASGIRALANGWYFCWVSGTVGGGITAARSMAKMGTADNTQSYSGDGASGLYCWGMQTEAAAFPSSYIPTTTASVARAADVLTNSDATSAPFGLFCEYELPVFASALDLVGFDNIINGSGLYIPITSPSWAWVREASVTTAIVSGNGTAPIAGTPAKAAGSFALNDVKASSKGNVGTADTSVAPPTTADLRFAPSTLNFGGYAFVYLRRVARFNFAPSNAQLQAMTT